jgi:hypothetical protein
LAAERALLDAIRGAATLEDFKQRLERDRLDLAAARALVQDKETARVAHFDALAEPVRARTSRAVLQAAEQATSVQQLVQLVSEAEQRGQLELAADAPYASFADEVLKLEALDVRRLAQVPSQWRAEDDAALQEERASHRAHFEAHTLPRAKQWSPTWRLEASKFHEPRHRRLVPVPDDVFARRVAEYVALLGGN